MTTKTRIIALLSFLFFIPVSVFAVNREAPFNGSYNSPVRIKWVSKVKKDKIISKRPFQLASPVITDSVVYVGSAGGYVYALDAKTGAKLWKTKLSSSIYSEPLVDGENLFIADRKGIIYGIAKSTGAIEWQVDIGEEISAKPSLSDDSIIAATVFRKVVALDKEGRGKKWQTTKTGATPQMTIKGSSSPIIYNGRIYTGFSDGSLVCYDVKDGNVIWEKQISSKSSQFIDVDANPIILNNTLYVSSSDGMTYAIDPASSKTIWSVARGGANDPVVYGDTLYVAGGAILSAIDPASGMVIWDKKFDDLEISTPILFEEEYLVTFSTKDRMYMVKKESGDVRFKRFIGKGVFGKPVSSDGTVYVLTNSSKVIALGKR